jgi:hypothetical protein
MMPVRSNILQRNLTKGALMSQNSFEGNPILETQLSLERLREYIAGGLAFAIVVGFLLTGVIAVLNLPSAEQFQRAKDLLLVINPFVGVVIGYYFSKVSSDARAASLQRAADAASQIAIEAAKDRERAEQQAQVAKNQADQMRGALSEMVTATETAKVAQPGNLGTLTPEQEATNAENEIQFRVALERAKRALNTD